METRGEVRTIVGGKKRVFKFGIRAHAFATRQAQDNGVQNESVEMIACLLYGGLLAREAENDLPEVFNLDTVLDWMDDLKPAVLANLVIEAKKALGFMSEVTEQLRIQEAALQKQNPATTGEIKK